MLNLYQSNELTVLARLFCDRHLPDQDPFHPLPVIVQNMGMGQWLKLRVAEHHGISANINCILPAAFLWQLYRRFLTTATPFKESPFARAHMAWRMMRILKEERELSDPISNYLAHPGDKDLRAFQLGNEIADLFDQYLMYRPDWMLKWQEAQADTLANTPSHQPEQWQQRLWQLLLADIAQDHAHKKDAPEKLHRAALHTQLMTLLNGDMFNASKAQKNSQLPDRLAVFGLSSMPPLQLDTLSALARAGGSQEIDIFFLNPCQCYWGDIISPKDLARRSIRGLVQKSEETTTELEDDDYLEIGNPILSSFGKQGREFFEMLLEKDQLQTHEHFVTPTGNTRLNFVKRDILELEYGGEFGSNCLPTPRADLTDQSIQLHGCHSRQREVEVLHDRILHIIRENPDIKLNDIIVMVPDINDYAPLVKTLFGAPLTCRIVDQKHTEQSALLTTFTQLLKLPFSRFTGADILDLLTNPAISRKFSLSREDLELIRRWIMDTRIGWETDGESKAEYWDLPSDNHNTWRFGLDRLLAGFAKSEASGVWQGLLPFDIRPGKEHLVGILCHVIERLNHYRREFKTRRNLEAWRNLLAEMVEEFFLPRDEEILDVNTIHECLEQTVQEATDSRYTDKVSLDLVRYLLSKALTDRSRYAGFIAGGITFATLEPMRSIPFRVVCLLGMNDGDYPRSGKGDRSYDCMAITKRRKGDRSGKLDDQYLFLEALLSAQDIFYLSYVSRGIRDNQPRPPSVLVTEWRSYLESIFTDFSPQEYPLQPFSPLHYKGGELQSFSETWSKALQSSRQEQAASTAQRFAPKPLPPNDSLDCVSQKQLEKFFRHSGKYFLQERLNVYIEEDEVALRESEPFVLDSIEKWALGNDAFKSLCRQETDTWQRSVLASGRIMPGDLGKKQLETAIQQAELIYQEREKFLGQEPKRVLAGSIDIKGRQIHYEIDGSWENNLLRCHVGRDRNRDLLATWIQHLFACAAGHKVTSHYISLKNNKQKAQTTSLLPVGRDDSIQHLEYLLDIYQEGIARPLLLAPDTSRAWYENNPAPETQSTAMEKVLEAWQGETKYDRYWDRLFDVPEDMGGKFQEMAEGIWGRLVPRIEND